MYKMRDLMRYAHCEGHLDLCYDDTGKKILTCGPDGDVRIYNGFDDDDPVSHRVGDVVYAVAYKNNKFYTASDDNAIQAYNMEDGLPDGVLLKFSGHAIHFSFNSSGTLLIAGASDFVIKVIDLKTNTQKVLTGHDAPVLAVALHPSEKLVASSSCDGTVRVWNIESQSEVKKITCLTKSNDFVTSKTLCRLTWDKNGKHLLVPCDKGVRAYDFQSWNVSFELTDDSINQTVSIASLSPCGRYVAASTKNGQIVVWELKSRSCVLREKHEKSLTITTLVWNPSGNEIAYADNCGYIGRLKDVDLKESSDITGQKQQSESLATTADLFDDGDDELLVGAADDGEEFGGIPGIDTDAEEEDDNDSIKPTQKLKSSVLQDVDEDTNASDKASSIGKEPEVVKPTIITKGWEPVPLQRPFQPSSCPVSLSSRFMVWNEVGIVVQYDNDEEQSINVEFHDTATHHALHVNNSLGHSMAALSAEALLLACESDEDSPSQLVCMHFGSWDSCKEWTCAMPTGEDIQAVCIGDRWLAVATDRRLVRIYSIGGIQRQIYSVPGPIVSMAAHTDLLMIVYHSGLGVPGDQCLGVQLMSTSSRKMILSDRLPISVKSTLVWLGFSSEATPVTVDSLGIIRLFNRGFCNTWITVAELRHHCKGKLDNFWVVGVRENPEQLRAILCKGSKYPPVLPRPTMQILPFKLPFCEISTDKGTLEENLWRTTLFAEHYNFWSAEGYEFDEGEKQKSLAVQQELLMKLFALACKSGREQRAVEICDLMPTSRMVQLAIKYATRTGLMQVAHRLNDVARQKADEETQKSSHDTEEDVMEQENSRPSFIRQFSEPVIRPPKPILLSSRSSNSRSNDCDEDTCDVDDGRRGDIEVEEGDDTDSRQDKPNSVLLWKPDKTPNTLLRSLSTSQTSKSLKNPFKVAGSTADKTPVQQNKGTSVFDSIEKPKSGQSSRTNMFMKQVSNDGKKPVGGQQKLFGLGNKSQNTTKPKEKEPPKKTGFQFWFDSNKESLQEEHPDKSESDLTVAAAKMFRQLSKEEQKQWQTKAETEVDDGEVLRKRKREDAENENDNIVEASKVADIDEESQQPEVKKSKDVLTTKPGNKLTAFSFTKS